MRHDATGVGVRFAFQHGEFVGVEVRLVEQGWFRRGPGVESNTCEASVQPTVEKVGEAARLRRAAQALITPP
jgi:hypothetical protein